MMWPAYPSSRISRVEATFNESRNNVMNSSKEGNPVKSDGSRRYRITSNVSNDSEMLMASSVSSRKLGIGTISNRTVPSKPTASHRSL